MHLTSVFLNIYDLDFSEILSASKVKSLNTKTIPLGFGAFHSGLEIFGKEISFSIGEGIHVIPPRTAVGAQFREAILLGETDKTRSEFIDILELMLQKYQRHSYHLFSKNCNHFTNDLTLRLLGVNIPSFLNKLSQFLKHFSSIIPDSKLGNLALGPPLDDEVMVDCLDKEVLLCVLMEEKASYYQCSIPEDQKTDEAVDFLSILSDPNTDERGSILAIKKKHSTDLSVVSFNSSFQMKRVDYSEEKEQNDNFLFSDEKSLTPTEKSLTPMEKSLTPTEKSLTPTEKSLTPMEKSPQRLSKITSRLRSRSVPKPQPVALTPPPLFHSSKNKNIGILKPSQQEFHTPGNSEDFRKPRSPGKSHLKSSPVEKSPLRTKKSSRYWFRKEKEEIPEDDFSGFLTERLPESRDIKGERLSEGECRSKSSPKNLGQQTPKNSKSPRNSTGKNPKPTKKGEESPRTEQDSVLRGRTYSADTRPGSRSSGVFKRFSRKLPEEPPPGSRVSMVDREPRSFREKFRSFGLGHQNSDLKILRQNNSQKIQKNSQIPEVPTSHKIHQVMSVVDEKEEGEWRGGSRLRCSSDPGRSDISWSKKSVESEENQPDLANSEEREIPDKLVSGIPGKLVSKIPDSGIQESHLL